MTLDAYTASFGDDGAETLSEDRREFDGDVSGRRDPKSNKVTRITAVISKCGPCVERCVVV